MQWVRKIGKNISELDKDMEHNSGTYQGLSFPFRLEEFYTIRYFSIILKKEKPSHSCHFHIDIHRFD